MVFLCYRLASILVGYTYLYQVPGISLDYVNSNVTDLNPNHNPLRSRQVGNKRRNSAARSAPRVDDWLGARCAAEVSSAAVLQLLFLVFAVALRV